MFSQQQIEELLRIIDFQHVFYIGSSVGSDILTGADIKLLSEYGVNVNSLNKGLTTTEEAFNFGRLAQALGNYQAKQINYNDFRKFVMHGGFAPLSEYEKVVLNNVKNRSYSVIKGLGDNIKSDVRGVINTESNKRRLAYEKIIRSAATRTVANRDSLTNMMLEIGEKTEDWERKLSRIVETEMHRAYTEGAAVMIENEHGKDALVYMDVYYQACVKCVNLFLTKGIGSEPKKFKLSELIANGDNIGLKTKDWKPVLPPVHPYCRCTLNHIPEGFKWNEEKKAYSTPDKTFVRKTSAHIKAPIKVTIGDKEYVV